MPKKRYIAAGLIVAGSAAAVTVYAVRKRREMAVDMELAGMLEDADSPAAKPSPVEDVMAAEPADPKANPV